MQPGMILANTPLIADAHVQLNAAATATEQNRQAALGIVASNADNFGGRGSEGFQQAIAQVNAHFDRHQQNIAQGAQALGLANDGFSETDGLAAAQYGSGGGGYMAV
jgi:uncharacterized protein YukE